MIRDMRCAELKERFSGAFGEPAGPFVLASAPGRLELAGNHTDHQGGRVVSTAIGHRAWALCAENGRNEIRLCMEGFGDACISLSDEAWTRPVPEERGCSVAIARGMAALFARRGGNVRGFDVVTTSSIPVGFGVSSSAAFEMLMGACVEGLFGCSAGEVDRVALALEGMEAERSYFGKMSGAQDQITSAVGGVVSMDFAPAVPDVRQIAFDVDACDYVPCLIDSRCDHSLYNDEYDAVPGDMFAVARLFGCERLGEVGFEDLLARLDEVRAEVGDAVALRALHFFAETRRVGWQCDCLEKGDFEGFLAQARLSGASSAQYLANVSPRADGTGWYQPAMVILALCAQLLGKRGAWRIHGGGFGGSVLAFVPRDEADSFEQAMNACLGYEACRFVSLGARGVEWERLAQ
ncbi:MAG: galactokinase [Eggerthellaceae bacterium]|nr:galactokinase [Eggerthellaceae bacterium]